MDTLVACPRCSKLNRVLLQPHGKDAPVCGHCKTELPVHSGVQDLEGKTLSTLIQKSSRPLVVDFWAPWCGPCRAFAPTFIQAAHENGGKMVFAKLNTEADQASGALYKVRSIPTLVVFNDGIEVGRASGALPLPELHQFLNRWIR
jgi:thioredoxin 2